MERFFFHVMDGTSAPDHEGVLLSGLGAARIEAVRLTGALLSEIPASVCAGDDWRIEVADQTGLTLFMITVITTDSPATRR